MFKPIKIHGKDYVPVNQRIGHFKKVYPTWSIKTEILELSEERVVVKATACNEDETQVFEALACEYRSSSAINKKDFIENADTSALGRALGKMNIGSEGSIATAEDMIRATTPEVKESKPKLTKSQFDAMVKTIESGQKNIVINSLSKYDIPKSYQDKLKKLLK